MENRHVLFYVFFAALLLLLPVCGQAADVTLYRDTWGVPHIYGDSWANAAYALGQAQAEDRLEDIYK
ncbi:MAG TPA: penicillin acylase family protein, partial [Candidatus Hydrogenedentes bacterium]|nr:penicillin acylase family protein [Candidatus Hydrogenedentota bacterium]